MKKRTRWILIILAIIVAALLIALSLSEPSVVAETVAVGRARLTVSITDEGKTQVRERYTIAAPVSGRLTRINLDAGDSLRAGELVTRIYPIPGGERDIEIARSQVTAAEARRREIGVRLDNAKIQFDQLERDLSRARVLAQDSILSKQELERTELELESARQQVISIDAASDAADADIASAKASLLGTGPAQYSGTGVAVRTPSSGRVLRVFDKSERVVQAGTPLIQVGDARSLEVVIDVLSEDAVRVNPLDKVIFSAWGGDKELTGIVRLVEPDAFTEISALGVTEQRVNIIADIFDPPTSLGSGYRVEAQIVIWAEDDVLTVPTSSLFQDGTSWMVFVVSEGRASLRSIEIGRRSSQQAQVVSGLNEGEIVIQYPSDQIEDGVKIVD